MDLRWKIGLLMVFSLALTACKQSKEYAYWLNHRTECGRIIDKCNTQPGKVSKEVCESARKAANEFSVLEKEMWSSPEDFGTKIRETQAEMVTKQQVLKEKKHTKTASKSEIKQLKEEYKEKKQQVDDMLAVIASFGQSTV